jgi:hypothetical protein
MKNWIMGMDIKKLIITVIGGILILVLGAFVMDKINERKITGKNIARIPTIEQQSIQRDSIIKSDCKDKFCSLQNQVNCVRDSSYSSIEKILKNQEEEKQERAINNKILREICKRTKGLEFLKDFFPEQKNSNNNN